MAPKRKAEGLEIVLTQVLACVLTLVTVVPMFAFWEFTAPASELVVVLIAYAAWFLVIAMIAPVVEKRWQDREPERAP